MVDCKHDLGVPDWKDAAAYPDPKTTTETQWRWEFLRRRPDYRQVWVEQYDLSQLRYDEMDKARMFTAPGNSRERYYGIGQNSIHSELFGVGPLAGPWRDKPPPHFFRNAYGWVQGRHDERLDLVGYARRSKAEYDKGIRWISFDLRRPLPEQMRKAEQHIQSLQSEFYPPRKPARHHKSKWPKYLRVIDARDAKTTWEGIFEVLLDEADSLSMSVEKYDALVDKNGASAARQLWEQAQELMFKLTR